MILTNLFKRTTIYKLFDFIRNGYTYEKTKNQIGKTFYSEDFKMLMRKYIKVNLKEDWLGRLYGVINPTIDINGNLDLSSMVIELDGNETNNTVWVKNWLYKQLRMVAQLFKIEKLYDYINMDISHVGPPEFDNYLIVFDLVARKEYAESAKTFGKSLLLWGGLTGMFFIFNAFFHFL